MRGWLLHCRSFTKLNLTNVYATYAGPKQFFDPAGLGRLLDGNERSLDRIVLGATTEHTEHTEKEGLFFRVFGVFRGCLHPPVLWFSVTRASM